MSTNKDDHKHEEHAHHLTPLPVYYKVFGGLIVLTFLTILTSMFDFGIMNIIIAMAIACAKAGLVVMFFMQLKFDDIGNKVTFGAAFTFLMIFIVFTATDIFFRRQVQPVKVEKAVAAAGETDQNKLRMATPELVAKGKALFATNCASCHGPEGKGDGVAAAALNPKPRNFTSGYWKFGGSPTRVFHTISTGSPGTGMASFAHLSIEDRYALAHYVRSLSPNHPDDTPEDLKAAGLSGGTGKGGEVAGPKQSIPVDVAMDRMEVPDQVVLPSGAEVDPQSAGAKLFKNDCMQCHGMNGVGAKVKALGVNPGVQMITRAFAGAKGPWVSSEGEFMRLVAAGFPGRGMPGIAHYSSAEWKELYAYVRKLTTR